MTLGGLILLALILGLCGLWWKREREATKRWNRLASLPRDENDGAC